MNNNTKHTKRITQCKRAISEEQERMLAGLIVEEAVTNLSTGIRNVRRILPGGKYVEAVF